MAHPNATYNKCSPMLALGPVSFEFHGKPSHASAAPEEGRNALDALILAMCGINALRQQMKSSSRVHGIVVKGGRSYQRHSGLCLGPVRSQIPYQNL